MTETQARDLGGDDGDQAWADDEAFADQEFFLDDLGENGNEVPAPDLAGDLEAEETDGVSVDARGDMPELRVLTGLQAGAAMPILDALIVGSDDAADVLLLDEGIASTQLRLAMTEAGEVTLEALADGVRVASGAMVEIGQCVRLQAGEVFRAADTWLAVRASRAPWEAWSPPASSPALTAAEASNGVDGASMNDSRIELNEALLDASDMVADARSHGTARQLHSSQGLARAIVAAGLLSTILGIGALIWQASFATARTGVGRSRAAVDPVAAIADATRRMLGVTGEASAADNAVTASAVSSKVTQTEIAPEPAVDKGPQATPTEQLAGDAETLTGAAHEGVAIAGGAAPGHRLVVRSPGQDPITLPFDIQEVLLGPRSLVILTDGRRLEPGDRTGAWRLAEIRPGALVFDGPRKVQVPW